MDTEGLIYFLLNQLKDEDTEHCVLSILDRQDDL